MLIIVLNEKQNSSEESLFVSIFSTLRLSPLHFFLLQIPAGFSGVIEKLLDKQFEKAPLLAVLIFFPVFCIASTVSSALTYSSLIRLQRKEKLSLRKSWEDIREKLGILIVASLTVGTVSILGLAALVLPAFYFMALYLFVPQLILSEPGSPLSVYLFRSTQIAKRSLWTNIATVMAAILIGILTYLGSQTLGTWAGGFSQNDSVRIVIVLIIDVVLSMLTGAIIDTWISLLFLKLRAK